jgi:hypothetical protein
MMVATKTKEEVTVGDTHNNQIDYREGVVDGDDYDNDDDDDDGNNNAGYDDNNHNNADKGVTQGCSILQGVT